jgi:hypothetical protein
MKQVAVFGTADAGPPSRRCSPTADLRDHARAGMLSGSRGISRPPLDAEDLLRGAQLTLEGLQLMRRLRWMRLEAREIHRPAAVAYRQQERVAQLGL